MNTAPFYTRTNGADPRAPSNNVWPRFFTDIVPDEIASVREGRRCFREEERVEIYMPGNNLNIPVHRVTDEHRQRWPKEYEAFKAGREPVLNGTPIEEWPALNRAQVAELKYLNFRTVEEIADANDLSLQRIGMGGRTLRDRAKAFLDDAHAIAVVEKTTAELDKRNAENESLKMQVAQQGELLGRLQAQLIAMQNAPNPLQTHIPGQHDPMEVARQQQGINFGEQVSNEAKSSLGDLQPSRRTLRTKPTQAEA
jgi:hypothetical protein